MSVHISINFGMHAHLVLYGDCDLPPQNKQCNFCKGNKDAIQHLLLAPLTFSVTRISNVKYRSLVLIEHQ